MSTITNTYNIGPTKKLIDINKDLVNFEARFKVQAQPTTQGNGEFEALIANQSTLDNNPDLPLKRVTSGIIEGSFREDKGTYQSYFLILRSNVEMTVQVSVDVREVPKRVVVPQAKQSVSEPEKKSSWNWKLIIGVLLAIVVVIALYFYFTKKPKEAVEFGTGLGAGLVAGLGEKKSIPVDAPILPAELTNTKSDVSLKMPAIPTAKNTNLSNRFRKFNLED